MGQDALSITETSGAAEVLPRVLPAGWREVDRRLDGSKYMSGDGMSVIASTATELDGKRWLHVSFARPARLPSWDDLRKVKDIFVGRDRMAVQVLPAASKYVNIHPFCLRLWCCLDGDPLPDFTRGGSTI